MIPRLLAFILPLGVDSFAVAAAIGASVKTSARQRLRITVIFTVFEAGMPLAGIALGGVLARSIGQVANYLAAAAVIVIGGWMLLASGQDDEEKAARLASSHGLALFGLGISISMDELAIGFSLGLVRLPLLAVIIAIGAQAILAAQLGLAFGSTISEHLRERAERLAGVALILLGGFLLAEQLMRH